MFGRILAYVENWTWGSTLAELPTPRRWAVATVRLLYVLVHDITDGQITLRAMGLVYTTLLSLAPLLAITFSMLKAFGMNSVMRPTLMRFLAPLGPQADRIVDTVITFVSNIEVGVLGAVGLALLLYAVISLIQKVEAACNYIWQVRRPRSLSRRFSEYLSVLVVGPVLVVSAGSMTASVTSNALVQHIAAIEPFGTTLLVASKLVPYFLWAAGFTFLFLFIPNTRVRVIPAAVGGLVSGVLWQSASLAFAAFASAGGNYNAIYASFAILIFLLIWLYLSWLIMLLGCRVAFLLQHPEQLRRGDYPPRAGAEREEALALLIMGLVAHHFIHHKTPWRIDHLAPRLGAVPAHVYGIVDRLVAERILVETEDEGRVVPGRDIDTLAVDDVLQVIRSGAGEAAASQPADAPQQRVAEVMHQVDEARRRCLDGMTIRDLGAAPAMAGASRAVAPD